MGSSALQLFTDSDYSEFVDEATFAARPNHEAEINYFKEPRNGRVISADTLLSCASPRVGQGGGWHRRRAAVSGSGGQGVCACFVRVARRRMLVLQVCPF